MSTTALLVLDTLLSWIIRGRTEVHQVYIPQYHKRIPRRMNRRHTPGVGVMALDGCSQATVGCRFVMLLHASDVIATRSVCFCLCFLFFSSPWWGLPLDISSHSRKI